MGILMASQKVTEDPAFDRLQRTSQRTTRKSRDIAA
jgi:AmiR/NasT family two-component response regulator